MLTKHENVPRKRPKFANFMKNVSRGTSQQDVNRVFDLIEEAFKSEREEQQKPNGASTNQNGGSEVANETEGQKRKQESNEEETEEPVKKKKKSKVQDEEVQEGENLEVEESQKENKKKKKKGDSNGVEETNGTNGTEPSEAEKTDAEAGFCWKDTIRSIVKEKGNSISVKKLQAKLLKAYKKQNGDTETVNEQTIDVVLKRKLKKMKNISIEEDKVVIKA